VSQAQRFDSAEATVMLAYPRTAAAIVTDLSRGKHLRWYFSPMLRDDALLWNVPQGSLSRAVGISPSLSQNVECTTHATSGDAGVDALQTASVRCDATIAERFSDYFASHWQGRRPLDAGHFYYDGVVMLALALQAAAEAGNAQPTPQELLPFFTGISTGDGEPVRWDSLAHGLELASNGTPIHYEGAAGEYEFNARGQNVRAIVSTWQVNDGGFVESQSVSCPVTIRGD
jgi:neutral amino acid transport system substrate-binding protein